MIDMASKQILPAVIRYTKELAEAVNAVQAAGLEASVQMDLLKEVNAYLLEARNALTALQEVTEKVSVMKAGKEQAEACRYQLVPAMDALRKPVDELEMIVDKEAWPMPSYGDLMFEV